MRKHKNYLFYIITVLVLSGCTNMDSYRHIGEPEIIKEAPQSDTES